MRWHQYYTKIIVINATISFEFHMGLTGINVIEKNGTDKFSLRWSGTKR